MKNHSQGCEPPAYFTVDPSLPKLKPKKLRKPTQNDYDSSSYGSGDKEVLSAVTNRQQQNGKGGMGYSMGSKGQNTSAIETPVLLVCIYNKKGQIITHDILYRQFSKYGEVRKILIFEKAKLWKAFVEMDSLQSARKSKSELNDFPLFEDGSNMNVYYSNMSELHFQNNNSGGLDYTKLKQTKPPSLAIKAPPYFQQDHSPILPSTTTILGVAVAHAIGSSSSCSNNNNNGGNSSSSTVVDPSIYPIYNQLISKPQNPNGVGRIETPTTNSSTQENESFDTDLPFLNGNHSNLIISCAVVSSPEQTGLVHKGKREAPAGDNSKKKETADDEDEEDQFDHQFENQLVDEFDDPQIFQSPQSYPSPDSAVPVSSNPRQFPPQTGGGGGGGGSSKHNSDEEEKKISQHFFLDEDQDTESAGGGVYSLDPKKFPIPVNHIDPLFNQFSSYQNTINKSSLSKTGVEASFLDGAGFYPGANASTALGQESKLKSMFNDAGMEVDPANYVNPLFLMENRKSKVIYVRGLQNANINAYVLYNLFSNFGNITKIMFLRNKRSALIEFENMEFATHAKDFLNGQTYLGEQVRIFYSNYENINLNDGCQETSSSDDVFFGQEDTHRFQKHRNMSINPPSCVLHISNLKKDSCNQSLIKKIFQDYGIIQGIKFITQNNYQNMCLIQFSTVEEALNAISFLHGRDIGGRKIQISFTRSQI